MTLILFAGLAPPNTVPAIVTVFNLVYPVPADTISTARYLVPFLTTVNVADVPDPPVASDPHQDKR